MEQRTVKPLTVGVKPPETNPIKARQTRKDSLLDSQNWQLATIDHAIICIGIHLSQPILLLMIWVGISLNMKHNLYNVFPKL